MSPMVHGFGYLQEAVAGLRLALLKRPQKLQRPAFEQRHKVRDARYVLQKCER